MIFDFNRYNHFFLSYKVNFNILKKKKFFFINYIAVLKNKNYEKNYIVINAVIWCFC